MDITVIVPVHRFDDDIEKYLNKAVESYVKTSNYATNQHTQKDFLMFVGPKDVLNSIKEINIIKNIEEVSFIENNNDTSFCSQVNKGISGCKTDYFSILEIDDTYTEKWFHNFNLYYTEHSDASVFLPLTEVYDNRLPKGPDGELTPFMFTNEAVWATSFSEELGYLDLESLENFGNFNLTGAIFKKSDYFEVGGLKESMKFSFWYEFLMRMAYNGKKMFVIPKVGYKHLINRDSSISDIYNKTMTPEEVDWWIDLAHKEYFFKNDRKKTYDGE